jgi:DNA repair protein RecO (recombination protein O)
MNIEDEGIIINVSHYSETSAIVNILTRNHGRMSGLLKGAFKKKAGLIQPGNHISFSWRAKSESNLGSLYFVDLIKNHFVMFMNDILRLYALQSACSLCNLTLPEKHPYPAVFDGLTSLLDSLDIDDYMAVYVFWEMGLLKSLGFEIDLSHCVACGCTDNLIYVSPRSAKAVCAEDGEQYKDKLFALPEFLLEKKSPKLQDILDGLTLTGYFLEKRVFNAINRTTPEARNRFIDKFRKGMK